MRAQPRVRVDFDLSRVHDLCPNYPFSVLLPWTPIPNYPRAIHFERHLIVFFTQKTIPTRIPLTLSHYCTRCAFYPRPIPIPPSIIWNNLKGPAPEAIPNRVLLPHLYHGPALVPGRCPCPSQHIRPPRCADRRRHQQYYMYTRTWYVVHVRAKEFLGIRNTR